MPLPGADGLSDVRLGRVELAAILLAPTFAGPLPRSFRDLPEREALEQLARSALGMVDLLREQDARNPPGSIRR